MDSRVKSVVYALSQYCEESVNITSAAVLNLSEAPNRTQRTSIERIFDADARSLRRNSGLALNCCY